MFLKECWINLIDKIIFELIMAYDNFLFKKIVNKKISLMKQIK